MQLDFSEFPPSSLCASVMGLMERVIRFAEQLGGALHARPRPAQLQQRPQVHPQDAQDAPQKLSESSGPRFV